MICKKNEVDVAATMEVRRQLQQKQQELMNLQQVQSDLHVEMESQRKVAVEHEAQIAELVAELTASREKLRAAEVTADDSARELQACVDQLQIMRRKESQLSREVSKCEAQVHAMYCLNTLITHPRALEIFTRLDTSSCGRLDASGLCEGLREIGEVLTEVELEELMSFVDEDGHGSVAYAELAKVGQMAAELQQKENAIASFKQEQQAQATTVEEVTRLREQMVLTEQQLKVAQAQALEAAAMERVSTRKLAESQETQESTEELLELVEQEMETTKGRYEDTLRQLRCKEDEFAALLKAQETARRAGQMQTLQICNQAETAGELNSRHASMDELEKSQSEPAEVDNAMCSGGCESDAQTWVAEWLEEWISQAVAVNEM